MSGKQAWRFAAVALFAAGVVAATAPLGAGKTARSADASPITPFVTCVVKQANHTYDALFGYDNSGAATTVATGTNNHFSAPAPNGKQPPSQFAAGHVTNAVFISNIPNGTDFTWSVTVDGVEHQATASSKASRCKSSGGGGGGTTTTSTTTTSTTPGSTTTPTPPPPPPTTTGVAGTSTTIGSATDVSIKKTASVATAHSGDVVTFTLRVVNHGPAAAEDAQAVDNLPTGLVFVSATASHGTCTQSRTVVCSFGTIPAGASRVAKVTARVQVAAALLHNVAVVTTSTVDTNAGNNTSHANVRVAATAAQQKVLKAKPAAVHAQPKFTG